MLLSEFKDNGDYTYRQLATIFGKTEKTVTNWVSNDATIHREGRDYVIKVTREAARARATL